MFGFIYMLQLVFVKTWELQIYIISLVLIPISSDAYFWGQIKDTLNSGRLSLALDIIWWDSVWGRISVILLSWEKRSQCRDKAGEGRVKIDWIAMRQLFSCPEPCVSQSRVCFSSQGPHAAPGGLAGSNFTQSNRGAASSGEPASLG